MISNGAQEWAKYRDAEMQQVEPVVKQAGFVLDTQQVHTAGERYLTKTRDVGGGGLKLVLTGTRITDGKRVIIKASSDPQGIAEIERERTSRTKVNSLDFALRAFKTPEELYYAKRGDLVISVTEYIEQDRAFFEHSLSEQFFLSLRALENQEGAHATTEGHTETIADAFGITSAEDYLSQFATFKKEAVTALPNHAVLHDLFTSAENLLRESATLVARYCGFLTHADFVPNNLRVANRDIYLLDYSSIHFGNKYEGWARFLNFMIHHHPALEKSLVDYVRNNRGREEYLSLRLMRIYKIGFLLSYYAQALQKTEGNLRTLTEWRLKLWSEAMQALLEDRPVSRDIIDSYVADLHALRSEDERARQKELLGVEKLGVK
jgi:hypothetical protein